MAEEMKRKKVQGQINIPFAKGKRPGKHDPVHPAQGSLMKERKKGPGPGKNKHQVMKVVGKKMGTRVLIDAPVFQDQGQIFDRQHPQVEGDAEHYFGQHGVHIGMPEAVPGPQGLAHVQGEDQDGPAIADEPDDHREIDNGLQFFFADDIGQKAGEKGPGPQGNNRQIKGDPEGEPEIIVHIGLVQPKNQNQNASSQPPAQDQEQKKIQDRNLAREPRSTPSGNKA